MSAFGLLDVGGYKQALGDEVAGLEDDGGLPLSNGPAGHRSAVRLVTGSGVELTVALYSLFTADDAKSLYGSLSAQAAELIPGVGDSAVYGNGSAFVRKGAQVLQVAATITGAAQQQLEQLKISGGDPRAKTDELSHAAVKVAPALAAAMKGTAATGPVVAPPEGAVDPCLLTSADVNAAMGIADNVTASYMFGDRPPELACVYDLGSLGQIQVSTVTEWQLSAAVPPTDATTRFANDQQAVSGAQPVTAFGGQAFQAGTGEPIIEILLTPTPNAHGRGAAIARSSWDSCWGWGPSAGAQPATPGAPGAAPGPQPTAPGPQPTPPATQAAPPDTPPSTAPRAARPIEPGKTVFRYQPWHSTYRGDLGKLGDLAKTMTDDFYKACQLH